MSVISSADAETLGCSDSDQPGGAGTGKGST